MRVRVNCEIDVDDRTDNAAGWHVHAVALPGGAQQKAGLATSRSL